MSDLDTETRAAVAALVHRLRNPGDTDPPGVDAERVATEFITAMISRGWYPLPVPPSDADETAGIREAARELLAFASSTRPDWTAEETWAAIYAAKTAGLDWDKLALRLMGIALRREDPPTRPRELWDFARGITVASQSRPPPADHVAGAIAALISGDYDAAYAATHDGAAPVRRVTGGQPVLTEGHDP